MTAHQRRRSVPDRARRRAIRAYAAKFGLPYSVAARQLAAQRVFALREQRSFVQRVGDTRLAAELPLGRAAHLVGRFPPSRSAGLYGGEGRQTLLALLYAMLRHETPTLLPAAEELDWVAELGEEAAVDIVCAAPDRAARLLLDEDPWHLWTRVEAALEADEAGADRTARDVAIILGRDFRTMILRRSIAGARHTLDAVLVIPHDGHPPGTRVRVLTDGRTGIVVGVRWLPTGSPTHYDIHFGTDVRTVPAADVVPLDKPGLDLGVLTST